MKAIKCLILLVFFLLFACSCFAQTLKVDICTQFKDAGTLQVVITPSEDFDGMVSNIQFTLVSPAADSVRFGEIQLVDSTITNLAVQKGGEAILKDSLQYQKFVAFGDQTLKSLGQKWEKGKEVVFFEIPIKTLEGKTSTIEVGNNAVTNDVMFNGMFYVECNFREVTGEIGVCAKVD